MTKVANPYPVGLNFGSAAARRLERLIATKAKENARRVACSACGLMILPENMPRHTLLAHEDTE